MDWAAWVVAVAEVADVAVPEVAVLEEVVPEEAAMGLVVGILLVEVVGVHPPGLQVAIQAAKGVEEAWSPPGVAEAVQPRL
jgi:hypothetical protein